MAITTLFELRFQPDYAKKGLAALLDVVKETRAFTGNNGVEVDVDVKDSAHVLLIEKWESAEHDAEYRAWRAGPGAPVDVNKMLAEPPVTTLFSSVADI
jgi:quinol monooxygenase YgiN